MATNPANLHNLPAEGLADGSGWTHYLAINCVEPYVTVRSIHGNGRPSDLWSGEAYTLAVLPDGVADLKPIGDLIDQNRLLVEQAVESYERVWTGSRFEGHWELHEELFALGLEIESIVEDLPRFHDAEAWCEDEQGRLLADLFLLIDGGESDDGAAERWAADEVESARLAGFILREAALAAAASSLIAYLRTEWSRHGSPAIEEANWRWSVSLPISDALAVGVARDLDLAAYREDAVACLAEGCEPAIDPELFDRGAAGDEAALLEIGRAFIEAEVQS